MTVSLESYIVIEKSLSKEILKAFRLEVKAILSKVKWYVSRGNYTKAHELVGSIDLSARMETKKNLIKLASIQSVLYGSSQVTDISKSVFRDKPTPTKVETATDLAMSMFGESGLGSYIKGEASKLIELEEVRKKDIIQKDSSSFFSTFEDDVDDKGKRYIDRTSGLQVSRLASWGFIHQALVSKVTRYEVSAAMDSATCPVCKTLDGVVYEVSSAKQLVDSNMSMGSIMDLKSSSPWPKHNKASIVELNKMTPQMIIDKGWNVPPYHLGCRCVMIKTNKTLLEALSTPVGMSITAGVLASTLVDELSEEEE